MPLRSFAAIALLLILAACSASPAETALPGATSGVPGASGAATGAPSATAGTSGTAPLVDLSGLKACGLVADSTVAALTGETGFRTDERADVRSASCFWAKPGAPQYLEVKIDRRTSPLGDYTLKVNDVPCTVAAVPGIGSEARGGICPDSQNKVWLIVLDRGVSVQVIVNEPKGTLTPADLVAVINAVLAGVG